MRRPGEPETAYVFADEAEFRAKAAEGGFVEWAEIAGNLYGTPQPDPPPRAATCCWKSTSRARPKCGRAVLRLCASSSRRLRPRSRNPGCGAGAIPESHIAKRLALADSERIQAYELNAIHVVNDSLAEAVASVAALIENARQERVDNDD